VESLTLCHAASFHLEVGPQIAQGAMALGVDAMSYEAFKVVTYMKSIIHELPNACGVTRNTIVPEFHCPKHHVSGKGTELDFKIKSPISPVK
jgi:hypothetical protein